MERKRTRLAKKLETARKHERAKYSEPKTKAIREDIGARKSLRKHGITGKSGRHARGT